MRNYSTPPSSSPMRPQSQSNKEFEPISHLCPSISSISASEDRVNALYCPFRLREANPDSYDLKLKFWTKAIEEFVSFGNRVTFTLKELQHGLMIHQKTPACLEDVLEHLKRNRVVLSEREYYEDLKASVSWIAWMQMNSKNLVTKLVPLPSPLAYFSRQSPEIRYVHLPNLKNIVDVVSKDAAVKNRLMSLSSFIELIVSKTQLSDPQELQLLLDFLKIRQLIELDKVGHEDVVLFGDGLQINDVEKSKYDVKRSQEIHEQKLEELYVRINESVEKTKQLLKLGRRSQAMIELKKKKLLEHRAQQLMNVMDTLNGISIKIDQAESDAKILQAYKSAKQALSDTLKKNNLKADDVTEAMLDIQDVLEEQAEITAAISQPIDGLEDDSAELDSELELLMKDKEEEDRERQRELRNKEEEEEDALRRLELLSVGDDLDESLLSTKKKSEEKDTMHSPA